jgi:UDP-N-acetyl-D-mannosaminuronate dehydrogenase
MGRPRTLRAEAGRPPRAVLAGRLPVSAVMVVGLGYVGLPLAARAVAAGHDVTGYDTDPGRVKRLEAGESYVEDVPAGEVAAALEFG